MTDRREEPATEAGRDFARRIAHFNILGDIGSIIAIEREARSLPVLQPDFCVSCEGQHDEGKHARSPAPLDVEWVRHAFEALNAAMDDPAIGDGHPDLLEAHATLDLLLPTAQPSTEPADD